MRRFSQHALALVTFLVTVIALSACAFIKPGSIELSQPEGIGPVRVHFVLCTERVLRVRECAANESRGQAQYLLGVPVPKGSTAPETITAVPINGAHPITYARDDEVVKAMAGLSPPEGVWPPPGTEVVGYLSSVFAEEALATREWTVDMDFGLPAGSDGGPFPGPFVTQIAEGWREVSESLSASRPVDCDEREGGTVMSYCDLTEEKELATSDLRIASPAAAEVFVGGKATLRFGLNFASTAPSSPSFTLGAASALPKAGLALSSSTFTPPALDPSTHRSSGSETVTVSVPSNAKPGTYEVTLTAKDAQGGSVSQVAKIEVTKPKLKLGKVKLNKAKGTATLSVVVPSAGTLTASGKGIAKVKGKSKGPKTLKLTIRGKGKTKRLLSETGKAKVRAKLTFKPTNGASVNASKKITLKKRLAG